MNRLKTKLGKVAKCTKCDSSTEGGATFVEGGNAYDFCIFCTKILEARSCANAVHDYIEDRHVSIIEKEMIDARKRRANGGSMWKKNEQIDN